LLENDFLGSRNEIDRNELFITQVAKKDRSKMNVCFTMKDSSLEKSFLDFQL
jgi:phosphoserine aminotransferase